MRVVVLADTHIRDNGSTRLPGRAWEVIRSADVVLHAGDVVGPQFLRELEAVAPVHAVLGNNDVALAGTLPETVELDVEGVSLAMVHDSGAARGRETRLHRRFPDAEVVIFGHSHIPWNAYGIGDQLLFNPESPTQRRRQPHRTLGVLHVDDGAVRAEIVVVD